MDGALATRQGLRSRAWSPSSSKMGWSRAAATHTTAALS